MVGTHTNTIDRIVSWALMWSISYPTRYQSERCKTGAHIVRKLLSKTYTMGAMSFPGWVYDGGHLLQIYRAKTRIFDRKTGDSQASLNTSVAAPEH